MNNSTRQKLGLYFKKLVSNGRLIRRFGHRAWNTYEHFIFEYHTRRNIREADTVAPLYPRRLYWIDPKSITHYLPRFDLLRDTGKIKGGNWDQDSKQLVGSKIYQRFVNHFENGVPWEETEKYQKRFERIKSDKPSRYHTIQAMKKKYALYDELYQKFSTGDYLTQEELAGQSSTKTIGDGGYTFFPRLFNSSIIRHEITVNISRKGELLPSDGLHRFIIARIAGINEIPVRILVRHKEWQKIRDSIKSRIKNGTSINELFRPEKYSSLNRSHNLMHPTHLDIQNIYDDTT